MQGAGETNPKCLTHRNAVKEILMIKIKKSIKTVVLLTETILLTGGVFWATLSVYDDDDYYVAIPY